MLKTYTEIHPEIVCSQNYNSNKIIVKNDL
jgi:hypothetical protein